MTLAQPVTSTARSRVALLVDGDNLSHDQAGRILILAGKQGDTLIRRVYGNAAKLPGWCAAPGFHLRHAGTGKNAADLLLTVEAMDLILRGMADVLVIASSDRDFSHLATHLREAGYRVIGLGEPKAPEAFRKSCTCFHVLPGDVETPAPKASLPAGPEDHVSRILADAGSDGLPMGQLGHQMRKDHDLTSTKLGSATWTKWLKQRPGQFELLGSGPGLRVRLKQRAPA